MPFTPIESGILLASIKAVALNAFFNGASRDTSATANATRQADAHQCPACPLSEKLRPHPAVFPPVPAQADRGFWLHAASA